ncbi:glycoside hydrolase family 16 protein [Pseudonocardia phyllosphaerae]|uniref:glycoside hydrolase family 16 protein n=1 Tax=Pseudonocardia phyllosphaerae TaxID=3390502 RepID=UPI00397E232C
MHGKHHRRQRAARGIGMTSLALTAVAALSWTLFVPPGTGGTGRAAASESATSALQNQVRPEAPAPAVKWVPAGGDEFAGNRLDPARWNVYNSAGGFGHGLRRPSAVGVGGGLLTITAQPRAEKVGVSGGIAMKAPGQLYGRWEFRARTDAGKGYSPAILLWPDSEKFPDDGEVDMMEIPTAARTAAHAFVHYGKRNDLVQSATRGDFTRFHDFALEWLPDRITWYVDGVKKWEVRDKKVIPTKPMHLCIQLDQGPARNWIPAPDASTPDKVRLQVDHARIYKAAR